MQDLKSYLEQIQALCEFSQKPNPTGIDLEHIFQVLEETKVAEIWDNEAVKKYQQEVFDALLFLATTLYRQDCHLEIEPPTRLHEVVNDGSNLKLVNRFTSGPGDYMKIRFIDNKVMFTFLHNYLHRVFETQRHSNDKTLKNEEGKAPYLKLPFLVYRAIELLTHLPLNTLRLCKASDCFNTFATLHKTKAYCSPRCRNRMGVYAARRKQKGP
jgi:predicted Zn-ribbon and HTH transcriptional regulator